MAGEVVRASLVLFKFHFSTDWFSYLVVNVAPCGEHEDITCLISSIQGQIREASLIYLSTLETLYPFAYYQFSYLHFLQLDRLRELSS